MEGSKSVPFIWVSKLMPSQEKCGKYDLPMRSRLRYLQDGINQQRTQREAARAKHPYEATETLLKDDPGQRNGRNFKPLAAQGMVRP